MAIPLDLLALSLLPVSRWRAVSALLRSGLTAGQVLEAQCADGRRRAHPPRWSDTAWARDTAARALARASASHLQPIALTDPIYPSLLLEIPDPPPVLWVDGQTAALSRTCVAIVGSRAGSPYALSVADRLGADLAARGVCIVSGLARGVDSAAHRGALLAGGHTIAVLGSGVDVVYPPEHAPLARDIAGRGALLSELLPGTEPKAVFFPRRNRIISGLARAVVVVEAGEKSGSLITARCALEQGRDVLAVPGNVLDGRNRGGHALLRDGARLVETADDVLEELGLGRPGAGRDHRPAEATLGEPVLAAMGAGEALDIGEISARSGLPVAQLLPRLLTLELGGALRREPGGRFVRSGRNVLG